MLNRDYAKNIKFSTQSFISLSAQYRKQILSCREQILSRREQVIYDWLQDSFSRELFLARKEWATLLKNDTNPLDMFGYGVFEKFFERPPSIKCLSENASIQMLQEQKFILYGFGNIGKRVVHILNEAGCLHNLVGIWDMNDKMEGTKIFHLEVECRPDKLDKTDFDFVLITCGVAMHNLEIQEYLFGLGIPEEKIFVFPSANAETAYFDKDIIIPRLASNEIFIDAGCYDFETSKRLLELNPNVGKIYAFEPDAKNYELVVKIVDEAGFGSVVMSQSAWWSSDTFLNIERVGADSVVSDGIKQTVVRAYAIDNVISEDELVTFIKMDIEGAEFEALKGAEKTIKRCRPKLAICIYHKPDDYLVIAEYIKSLVPDYKAYMRHYSISCSETVLYCVI